MPLKPLSLELSEAEMQLLQSQAARGGQTVEEFVRAWIQNLDEEEIREEEGARFSFSDADFPDTVASNPGGIAIQWTCFFRAYPLTPLGFGAGIAALTALVWLKSAWWILLFVPVVWLLRQILHRIQAQFRAGDTNPGVILSQEPPLVAALTDLTQGGGSFPVVKILRQPLRACGLGGAAPGTRVATVSLYSGAAKGANHWSDFDPVVVQAATRQPQIIRERLDSIAAEQWQQLETAVASLPQRTPGVYPLGWQPKPGTLLSPALGGNESKQG